MNNQITTLEDYEIEFVAGGPIGLAVRLGLWVAGTAAAADAANKLITVGEKIHDAVCVH